MIFTYFHFSNLTNMKKYYFLTGIVVAAMIFSNCSSSKKVTKAPPSTYAANVSSVITGYCSPCHIPAKGGNKKPYDNFANVKKDIDEILRRIKLNPTDRGFMPFKKQAKLSDSVVMVFQKWKDDGMLEKL